MKSKIKSIFKSGNSIEFLLMLVVYLIIFAFVITNYKEIKHLTNENVRLHNELIKYEKPIDYKAAPTVIYDIPLSDELQEYTWDMCRFYNVPDHYEVILGLMSVESEFDENAISETDDYGLMQINICNHEELYNKLGIEDIMDPKDNIRSGVYIYSTLYRKHRDVHKVLMCYNMGPSGAAAQWSEGNYKSVYSEEVLAEAFVITEKLR